MSASRPLSRLAAIDVVFRRGSRPVLDGASLAFSSGELVSLLGANGAGKTTLLRLMLGLDRPAGGTVTIDGSALGAMSRLALARRLAYVPQRHDAPFPYSVGDVVALGRIVSTGLFGRAEAADRDRVAHVIEELGIGHLAARPYTELSGGERQLTLIARAMAQGAGLIIMDEPLSGLDFGHQIRLLDRLGQLAAEGYGILMTSHSPEQALAASTRVASLVAGRIDDDGAPEHVITPAMIRRVYGVASDSARFNLVPQKPGDEGHADGKCAPRGRLAGDGPDRGGTGPGRSPDHRHGGTEGYLAR